MMPVFRIGSSSNRLQVGALALGAIAMLSLAGCKKQPKSLAAPSASAQAAAAPVPPSADPELWNALVNISKACKVDEKQSTVICTQAENRKLTSEFVANRRPREKALPTLSAALSDKTPALRAVASHVLHTAFRTSWGSQLQPGAVAPKDATDLLNATLALETPLARQALPAAVHASMLANQSEALYAALAQKEPQLRAVGTRYMMTHGRLAAFDKVREAAKDPDASVVLAAMEAPQNMPVWTEAEQAAVCPWATELLGSDKPPVASKAAALLSSCQGEFVDKLITFAEKALEAGKFTSSTLGGLRDLCSPGRRGSATGASEAQCKRSRKLLEKVVEAKTPDEQTRSMALVALAYQWPDDETLKLAERLSKSKEATLAEHARRTIQRIQQRKQLASKSAPSSVAQSPGAKPTGSPPSAPRPQAVPAPQAPGSVPAGQ